MSRSVQDWGVALAVALMVFGGSVANADTIVNIKGYGADGAGANILSYPVAPGTRVDLFNPVEIVLPAGDWLLSDAWGQPGALYDAWNFSVGTLGSWASHYIVASHVGGQFWVLVDAIGPTDPTCSNHFCAWSSKAQASAAFLAAPAVNLHLDRQTTVAFASADYYLLDNAGGISVLVKRRPRVNGP